MVGVGIIGWGLAGRGFHGGFILGVEGLALRAVATSRDVDAERFGDVAVVADAAALVARDDVDLVVVASPNRQHVEHAKAALAAGKHVVVEKPVAPDAASMRDLASAAQRAGRLLVPFQNRRYDGDFATVRAQLEGGHLGKIHRFESMWPAYRPSLAQRSAWKAESDPMHGLMFDLGPHLVDQAIVCFGRPTHVAARVQTRRPGSPVTDAFIIELRYGELTVRVGADHLDPVERPRFFVCGDAASFVKYGVEAQEAQIRSGALPHETPDWGMEAPDAYGKRIGPEGEVVVPTERGDYRQFYAAVRDAIVNGGPSPIDPYDVVLQLEILEAAVASEASNAFVPMVEATT
ncbi:MAG: Gfo/Idh/MocA family oxidoreductase [Deltaproteobacteria bacterium]